eukprot:358582-Chlamydomonas_euryale.AAC.3
MHCGAMQCSVVKWSESKCHFIDLSDVQCSAVQCSAVQCSAVQCSAVQRSAVKFKLVLSDYETIIKICPAGRTIKQEEASGQGDEQGTHHQRLK